MKSILSNYLFGLFFFIVPFIACAQDSATSTPKLSELKTIPGPLLSPPFPSSDWDGGPVIGEENDTTVYPFQKLLGLEKNSAGIRFYGWVDVGGNLSTSHNSNVPTSYDLVPNHVELDQIMFRISRDPNIAQNDHLDWGFLVDNIYGTDYRYTIAKGIFSGQLLEQNRLYGYDPAQIYGQLFLPKFAEGMLIKVGRFISPADIEAQWAPDNYLFSHSLMFAADPYTYTGAEVRIKLDKNFQIEIGAHAGDDMAPWSESANLNGLFMVRWVSDSNHDSLYGGTPSIGNGNYTKNHDNLQQIVVTWGHEFSDKIHMMTEAYYMWEKNALKGGTVTGGPSQNYLMATGPGSLISGTASSVGVVNYFEIYLSKKNYLSIRNDFLNDPQGNRTGFATVYSSHTIGVAHHFNEIVTVRPEIRYETAYAKGATPYDNGIQKDQLTASADLIVRF